MADRTDFFFRQKVSEAELDLAFDLLEKADRNLAVFRSPRNRKFALPGPPATLSRCRLKRNARWNCSSRIPSPMGSEVAFVCKKRIESFAVPKVSVSSAPGRRKV